MVGALVDDRVGVAASNGSRCFPITPASRCCRDSHPFQCGPGLSCRLELQMKITIYGIKNCDTMKKARAWLDKRGVNYAFHDYKTAGIERAQLEQWAKQ